MPIGTEQEALEFLGPNREAQARQFLGVGTNWRQPGPEERTRVVEAERPITTRTVQTETGPVEAAELPKIIEAGEYPKDWARPVLREEVNPAWVDAQLRQALTAEQTGQSPLLPDAVNYWLDRLPWIGQVEGSQRLRRFNESARQIERGRASGYDFAVVADLLVQSQKESERSWPRKVFDLGTQLPAFATEFAATGPAYSLGKAGARKALSSVIRNAAETRAVNALSSLGGVALHTMMNPAMISRNIQANLAENVNISQDDLGQLQVLIQREDDDFKGAIQDGLVQSGIEYGSERLGFILEKPLAGFKAAVAARWLAPGQAAGRTVSKLKKVLDAAGWHGVVGEMFEERVGEAMSFLHGEPYRPPTWQDLAAEAVAFSLPGLGVKGVEQLARWSQDRPPIIPELSTGQPGVPPIVPGPLAEQAPQAQPSAPEQATSAGGPATRSDRWWSSSEPISSIPGEPLDYLDVQGDDPGTARATLFDVEDEEGKISYLVETADGRMIRNPVTGRPEFADPMEARTAAEDQLGQPTLTESQDYANLIRERETTYGPTQERAGALRRRVRQYESSGAARARAALQRIVASHPHGAAVTVYPEEFYARPGTRIFLSDDESAVAVVTPERELISVARAYKGPFPIEPVLEAAAPHALTLDAFETAGHLTHLYSRFGFRPYARVGFSRQEAPADWNYDRDGTPDVVFMARDPQGRLDLPAVPSREGWARVREAVPRMTYDQALDAKQAMVDRLAPALELREPGLTEQARAELGNWIVRLLKRFVPAPRLARFRSDFFPAVAALKPRVPNLQELIKMAQLGATGRKWYQLANAVIQAVAKEEAWRFAGVLAATSTNKGVTDNLPLALRAWKVWTEAGRPTDKRQLKNLLFRPEGSHAWHKPIYLRADLANTIAVLRASNYEQAHAGMSAKSPKVRPFYRALMGELDAVVNDTWMERVFGFSKKTIGQLAHNTLATVMTKEVARRLGWAPAEAQAAIWAAGRVIGERINAARSYKRAANRPTMEEILNEEITTELLMPGDDLASLMVRGYSTKTGRTYDYAKQIQELGFDLEAGRQAYAAAYAQLIEPAPGVTPRGALGPRHARTVARRFERGYTGGRLVLREAGPGQSELALPADESQSPQVQAQLELELAQQIAGSVPEGTHGVRGAGGLDRGQGALQDQIQVYSRRVAQEFQAQGKIDLRGKECRNIAQAATLFQVYRDPRYETFRYVFVRDGVVRGTYAVTCRRPGSTVTWVDGDGYDTISQLMRELKADGYWVMHNHPSGNPLPSGQDAYATELLARNVSGFQGHIVIDHQRFARINADGSINLFRIKPEGGIKYSNPLEMEPRAAEPDPLRLPTATQPAGHLLGQRCDSPETTAELVAGLQLARRADGIGLIFADARLRAVGFGEVRAHDLASPDFVERLRDTARGLGASRVLGFYEGLDFKLSEGTSTWPAGTELGEIIASLVRQGVFTDMLLAGLSMREHVGGPTADTWIGLRDTVRSLMQSAVRVEEPSPEYKARKFGQRLASDAELDEMIRQVGAEQRYAPIPNEITLTQAMAIVDQQGLVNSLDQLRDETNGMVDRVRVTLGEALIKRANWDYEQNRAMASLDVAIDAAEFLGEYGTRLGQGVQAFKIFSQLSPEGMLRLYKRTVDRGRARAMAKAGLRPGAPVPRKTQRRLPRFDPQAGREIYAAALAAQKQPAGFQREEAMLDVLAKITRKTGLSPWDLSIALWYANILSGWTTQARNFFGTLSNLVLDLAAHGAAYPRAIPTLLAGAFQGFGRGTAEAWRVLRTGKVVGTRIKKMEVPRILELKRFKGPFYPLNAWKYVFRIMAASDMMFFRSAEEMQARFLARTLARQEGLKGSALTGRMAEILHNAKAQRQAAYAQAEREGLKGADRIRRAWEVMEQSRPEALVRQAADYGRFATFNQEPDGVLGVAARGIASMSRQFPPLRLLVPFTHVVANVSNNALNFTPWGYLRLFNFGNPNQELAPSFASPEYRVQAARATLGTLGMAALYALALAGADDEDPEFAIYAQGPADPRRANQLRQTGWRPYSVKVGKEYYPYQYTSLHMGLAMLGNLLDAAKWKKLDDADALNRFYYVMSQVPNTVFSQSFLVGLSDFFRSISRESPQRSGTAFGGLARTSSSILIPNLAKQVDRMFDPTIFSADTVQAALLRDVPVARQGLRPMINVLGDTVKAELNPFFSRERSDRLWLTLARKEAFISTPDKLTMVWDRPMTPVEYYRYVKDSGRAIRAQLEPRLELIESLDRETAQEYVSRIVRNERAASKRRLFGIR